MINPLDPTNFERTDSELEEFLLFCVVVAGKNALQQAKKLDAFLSLEDGTSPFSKIRNMCEKGNLRANLELVKMGQYTRIERVFSSLSVHNVSDLSLESLEAFPGIGPKTSRFFFLHSYPNQNIAVLDTHILAWMREKGYKGVPKSTPAKNKYKELEAWFLLEADIAGLSPSEFDFQIWKERSQKKNPELKPIYAD